MFQRNQALAGHSRVGTIEDLDRQISRAEIAALIVLGVTAALWSAFVKLGLRIPGSALLSTALPIGLGFSVVPRRLAGTAMSGTALVTVSAMSAFGIHVFGVGALTSLIAIGPCLDMAVSRARSGWRLYLSFLVAGLATNFLAFSIRGSSKVFGFDAPDMRPLGDWFSQAAVTYGLVGAFAGLFTAACWFRFQETGRGDTM
jgi:hypothetical protein